jgi:ABC-2 type transport system permease protein
MNLFILVVRHEWKLFRRNRMLLLVLAVFVLAGLYAIYYGNAAINQQQANIQQIRQQNAQEQAALAAGLRADTTTPAGLAAWEKAAYPSKARFFLNYYAMNEPAVQAKLSIGQRDVNNYYLQLNAQNLYLQLFKSEIANPRKLLAGNFDLSFVMVYLLPLLIIACTYPLLSEEKERGTWAVIKVQPVRMQQVLAYKYLFWLAIIAGIIILLSTIAFVWTGMGAAQASALGWWFTITLSYAATWFGFTLLINTFQKSSAFNAMASLAVWLLFLVVIPALLNLSIAADKSIDPNRLTDFIRRRQGLGESRQEKQAVLDRFYALYPQYRNADTSAANHFLEFQAYSAFVTLLDKEAQPSVDAYYQHVWDRHETINAFNFINPAVNTQHLLNAWAGSGLENAFSYRKSIMAFHWQLSDFCFKPLFAGRLMTEADFVHIPVFKAAPAGNMTGTMLKGLGWLWLLLALVMSVAFFRLRYRL